MDNDIILLGNRHRTNHFSAGAICSNIQTPVSPGINGEISGVSLIELQEERTAQRDWTARSAQDAVAKRLTGTHETMSTVCLPGQKWFR